MQKDIKKMVRESKERCKKVGLDRKAIPVPKQHLSPQELEKRLREYQYVLKSFKSLSENLIQSCDDIPILFAFNDQDGNVLGISGKEDLLNQLGLRVGIRMVEEDSGTSSITLALMHKQPVQLAGKEHYHTVMKEGACYSVPFIDRHNQKIIGAISLMLFKKPYNPLFLGLLNALVKSMEREMAIRNSIVGFY